MRPIKYFSFYEKDKFVECCKNQFRVLHNTYGYYFCDLCTGITDIENLLKKKKDYVNHRVNVYYTEDECYMVCYQKNSIIVEVLLDCKGTAIAHKLVKDFLKLKEVDEPEEF